MKKIKLLAPILGIATISSAVVPMVGCSCKNNSSQQIDLGNNTIGENQVYGISKNFDAGTNYQFNADLSKWKGEFGKPDNWSEVNGFYFDIKYIDENKTLGKDDVDASQAQIIVGGKTLTRNDGVSPEEQPLGTWSYFYSNYDSTHEFYVNITNGNPIKADSKVSLTNIKFKSNVQNVIVMLHTIAGK